MASHSAPSEPTRIARKRVKNALTETELTILRDYCEILEGSQVHITKHLDTATYERMKLIFERLGGVYMPVRKRFTFDFDPTPLLERMIALEQFPEKNPLDFFYSPPPVAEALLRELEWGHTMEDLLWLYEHKGRPIRMIETSAGLGHLADVFRARYPMATIDVCELDPFRRAVLESKGYHVVAENAFDYHPSPASFYDICVLNPPFTIDGDTFTFIKHIEHAYGMLFDNEWSKLVSVVPSQFARVEKYRTFYIQVLQYGSHEYLAEGSFVESGTKLDTSVISLRKRLNHFYATWDESDTEDGFLNLRVRESWRYISVDEPLYRAQQQLIDDMLEGRLVVYSDRRVAQQTQERIRGFCQKVTERLLSTYQAYIPFNPADLDAMEQHILFEYRLQHAQYAQSKQWEWERAQERQRNVLQATIDQTQQRIGRIREQLLLSEQALASEREALGALEGRQVPTFVPAEQPHAPDNPLLHQPPHGHTATVDDVVETVQPPRRARYIQHAFF